MRVVCGRDVANEVLNIIEGAKTFVVLVSAYFDPWTHLDTAVRNAAVGRGVKTILIVRGSESETKQYEKAEAWKAWGVQVGRLDRLHAKFYMSDKGAVVTSLNLVKESVNGSWEAGVVLDPSTDKEGMQALADAMKRLIDGAKEQKAVEENARLAAALTRRPVAPVAAATTRAARAKPASKRPASPPRRSATEGTCISCGESIKLKLDRPFCRDCFAAWRDETDEDPNEEQSFCHTCGDEMASTFRKPRCKECWTLGAGE